MQDKIDPNCLHLIRFLFLISLSIFFLLALSSTAKAQWLEKALPKPQPIQEMADVQLLLSQTTLSQQHQIRIYLQILNKSNSELYITAIDTTKTINFIQLQPENFQIGTSVSPQHFLIIPFTVTTQGNVQTGKQLLVFDVGFAWSEGGTNYTGNLVLTKEVDVEILGESQLLSLLGIPTFLVLPGFLMLVTLRLILTLRPKSSSTSLTFLQATNSEFWLLVITLSIVFAPIYIYITQHNYLVQYSLFDVITVWFSSILLVAVPAIIIKGCYSLLRPKPRNSQITTLYKLGFRGLSIWRPSCKIKEEANNQTIEKICFLLERNLKPTQDEVWVCPGIVVQLINKEASLTKDYRVMVGEVANLPKKSTSLLSCLWTIRFAHLLARGTRGKDKAWNLVWAWSELGAGPRLVKRTVIDCSTKMTRIFSEE